VRFCQVCANVCIEQTLFFRYFSDRLSDTDVFLAPVLFRVVAGCVLDYVLFPPFCAAGVMQIAVKSWSSDADDSSCLTLRDSESVCVLDNKSNSVR
jgi:hypothetical protein